jgi:squalene-hopene/tetraprenyl-beta-curcumene cyclase
LAHSWCCRIILFIILAGTIALVGCADPLADSSKGKPPDSGMERIGQALASAEHYLIDRQDADGAWRSDTYGVFKDGPSLTPLVLDTLLRLAPSKDVETACRKGADYLAAMVGPDGAIEAGPNGLSYPLYTSALAVRVLSRLGRHSEKYRQARDAWLAFLRQRQLTEDLGWQPTDKPYGGWGYCHDVPRKPKPGESMLPLTESNLSATVFALEALKAAGCPADDPAIQKALVFVQRCQNFCDEAKQRDPAFDDGGFFFIYDDPVRNKAGSAGKDRAGRERFHSYGSTTADGLRGLRACGLPKDHPRVVAARRWLERHFDPVHHPGAYNQDREVNRSAVYYYYYWSMAQGFSSMGIKQVNTEAGPVAAARCIGLVEVSWVSALAEELIKRQEKDGSWINPAVAVREDDPVVATSLAAGALAVCRDVIQE